jgi:hypothetical protein
MGTVQKINFPYFIDRSKALISREKRMVIFFGTDFYNLPLDSNRENYIVATNKMLDYIRRHFAGFKLIYQAHPNEKEELEHLNLAGFTIGEKKVAEVFLYENAPDIEYTFSTCSWANGSAFAMGINSAVFLNLLKGSISDESITGYHSYFEGLPQSFFITSYDTPPPHQEHKALLGENDGMQKIREAVGNSKKVWVLATDPALALRGALLGKQFKKSDKDIKIGLLLISNRRWSNVKEGQHLFDIFDEVIELPHKRVWYSGRIGRIISAIKVAFKMKKLPLMDGDTMLSFSHFLFEENCIASYFPKVNKIILIESRWYFFSYENQYKKIADDAFVDSFGIKFFNYVLEPILGLRKTLFKEMRDGKVINLAKYKDPLEEVFNTAFVVMPDDCGKA